MPIATLTTQQNQAFMKLGNIRKGDRGGKNGAPRDLDHFRVTHMPGPKARELEDAFRAAYGPEPTAINVRFPYNEISRFWDANYECYKQGGLVAQAGSTDTGAYWIFYRDPDNSEVLVRNGQAVGIEGRKFMDNTPCDVEKPIYYNDKKEAVYMKPAGRLQCVIPELAGIEVGFYEFCPQSPRDMRNITAELSAFDAIARAAGKGLAGVPFQLIRREEEVTKKINGKLVRGSSWVVHITTSGDWGRKALEVVERMALPEIIDAEAEDVDEDFPQLPYTNEPIVVTTPAPSPAASTDTKDEMISPFDQKPVEYAAKKWNMDKVTAAKELGRIMREGKGITDPMSKKSFKKFVDGV